MRYGMIMDDGKAVPKKEAVVRHFTFCPDVRLK
jgi:hypothetical protein